VVCLPARTDADQITASMLAQLLERANCSVQLGSVASLTELGKDIAEKHAADVVCISATPPVAIMHARHLCRNLRRQFPEVNLIVGLWGVQGDLDKIRLHIGCGAIVVRSLVDAQAEVQRLRSGAKSTNQAGASETLSS
jgi:hypothetical protein